MQTGWFSWGVSVDLGKAIDTVDYTIMTLLYIYIHFVIYGRCTWVVTAITGFHHIYNVRTECRQFKLGFSLPTMKLGLSLPTIKKYLVVFLKAPSLGPLLFLIYIKDIYRSSNKFNYTFMLTIQIFSMLANIWSLEIVVNYGLAMIWVCESLNTYKLLLNTGKSNLVIFRSYQRKANINANLTIFDNELNDNDLSLA